ncbi:hypothetical protein IAU60_003162 [Kwoniella sp. DSM 27419]
MPSPLGVNLILNALTAVCSAVFLGISAYIEHTIGYHSATFTYDAFVGAFTIVALLALVILRLAKPATLTLIVEAGVAGLLWIFWLALAKSIFKSTCRDIKAQLAFTWIGFVFITATVVYLIYLGTKRANSVSLPIRPRADIRCGDRRSEHTTTTLTALPIPSRTLSAALEALWRASSRRPGTKGTPDKARRRD